ncbi:MAG TPA: calcium-binding protein [Vicinamibacterales bacterium]|nr:calcium-binding protein [Vicinamibacterales bacterium]
MSKTPLCWPCSAPNGRLLCIGALLTTLVLPAYALVSSAQVLDKVKLVAGVVLRGTDGEDVLEGTPGDDLLEGLAGPDWLFGMAGDDTLRGGDGDDTLDGGPGDDVLAGGAGDDILDGGEGNDYVTGGDGADTLDGGDGDDTLDGGAGDDDLDGGDGDDLLRGGDGDDVMAGGAGRDTLFGGDGQDVMSGGAGDDVLDGGDGDDTLFGGAGDDTLDGHDGDDVLRGDGGSDRLTGGLGNDGLFGGEGNDFLDGGPGSDTLSGGNGNDHLLPGLGADSCTAGPGDDVIVLRAGDVPAGLQEMLDGGEGTDTLILEGFSAADITRLTKDGDTYSIRDPLTGGTYTATGIEHIRYAYTLTSLSAAPGARPAIVVTNPSATAIVTGTLALYDKEGKALVFAVTGGDDKDKDDKDKKEQTELPITVPPLGRLEIPSDASVVLPDGSAELRTDRPIGAIASTPLSDVTGASVPMARSDSFIVPLFIDRASGSTTGVAVVCGDTPCKITITPYDLAGTEIGGEQAGGRQFDLPPHGQTMRFGHELFPRLRTFDGTMRIDGGPLSAAGLDAREDGRMLGVFPAVPAAPFLAEPAAGDAPAATHVARITAGDGASNTLLIVNAGPGTAKGAVAFFGEGGEPLAMPFDGRDRAASVPFELASGAALALRTAPGGAAVAGSAQITGGPGVSGLLRFSLPGGAGTGASSMAAVEGFLAAVERQASTGLTTEVSISSPGAASTVTLVLRDAAGREVQGGRAEIQLPANGQAARTIDQWFPGADTSDLRGTVTAVAKGGSIAAIVIIAQPGANGRLAMVPVIRLQ